MSPAFSDADFAVYAPSYQTNEEWNGKRLEVRRKLEAFGKLGREAAKLEGLELDVRTSLHHPFEFNGHRVRQQWTYLTRGKKAKTALKKVLGRDLGKDLDSAYRNAYLALTIGEDGLEIALKIHPDAWYDGQNLKNKCQDREGLEGLAGLLQRLPGFEYRIHDWKKIHNAPEATIPGLQEFFSYYTPGEHRFLLYHKVGREDPLAAGEEFTDLWTESLRRLAPVWKYAAWSMENDHLHLRT